MLQLSVQANTAMQVFDFMILENLFREKQVQQIYDLKGLSKERYNLGITEGNSVLFDGNLREKNQKLPTFVSQKSHEWLSNILTHDTGKLSGNSFKQNRLTIFELVAQSFYQRPM
jgi:hypothetical protein